MIFDENKPAFKETEESLKKEEIIPKRLSDYQEKPIVKEDIKKSIENWNNKPEVKNNGIVATTKTKFNTMKAFTFLGVIALIVLIAVGTIFAYTLYKDGS